MCKFFIFGMICERCFQQIEDVLIVMFGVRNVIVFYMKFSVVVEVEFDVNEQMLINIIKVFGYMV